MLPSGILPLWNKNYQKTSNVTCVVCLCKLRIVAVIAVKRLSGVRDPSLFVSTHIKHDQNFIVFNTCMFVLKCQLVTLFTNSDLLFDGRVRIYMYIPLVLHFLSAQFENQHIFVLYTTKTSHFLSVQVNGSFHSIPFMIHYSFIFHSKLLHIYIHFGSVLYLYHVRDQLARDSLCFLECTCKAAAHLR